MSNKTLQEQLRQLFPPSPVNAAEVRAFAFELSLLGPNAQKQRLGACLQAVRASPNEHTRIEQREHLAALLIELAALKGNFLDHHAFLSVREELLDCAGRAEFQRTVKCFEKHKRARAQEEHRLRDEKESWHKWTTEIQGKCAALSSIATDYERQLQELTDEDLQLCLVWANRRPNPSISIREQWASFVTADRNDALRLWSARSAEMAAISFLTDLGKQTTDVSIRQIAANSTDWKTHDVEADREPIDVKNARKSFSSQDSYVEHVIPEFKQARRLATEVTVLGVLSDYVPWAQINRGSFGVAKIIGQLGHEDLVALASWMDRHFGDILDFDLISTQRLATYPGWLFEYPAQWYLGTQDLLNQIGSLLKECSDPLRARKIVPTYVYTFFDDMAPTPVEGITSLDLTLLSQLTSLRQAIGLSRRSLFGWVLGVMLRTLNDGGAVAVKKTAASLRRLLFLPGSNSGQDPAGLFDPLAYVSNLISMFESIGSCVRPDLLRSMRFFKLTGPTTLRGRLDNGGLQTVFAHCGGWRRRPAIARCNKNPIHLGNSDVCPECGFLICSDCGHCRNTCSLREERMHRLSEQDCAATSIFADRV